MATVKKHLAGEGLAIKIVTGKVDGKDKTSQINFPIVSGAATEKVFEFATKISSILLYPVDGFSVIEKSELISE